MKLVHLADLHIGKRLKEISLYDDQKYILDQIMGIIAEERPDAVLIAGDVYDKPLPSGEAVTLLDSFLSGIVDMDIPVMMVSGNHDSAERIAFGCRMMDKSGLHISPVYEGDIRPVTISDGDTEADVWMMPFIRPSNVRRVFPEAEIGGYNDAAKTVIEHMDIDDSRINILVAHQNCIMQTIGNLDYIDPALFDRFDYTALGHIHKPQDITDTVRYCGSPLHYSLPETEYDTSVTVVDINGKNEAEIRLIPLHPLHEMRETEGTMEELEHSEKSDDYVYIKLTDEDFVPYAANRLRNVFPNLMEIKYTRFMDSEDISDIHLDDIAKKKDEDIFAEFFANMNNREISEEYLEIVRDIFRQIEEEEA